MQSIEPRPGKSEKSEMGFLLKIFNVIFNSWLKNQQSPERLQKMIWKKFPLKVTQYPTLELMM